MGKPLTQGAKQTTHGGRGRVLRGAVLALLVIWTIAGIQLVRVQANVGSEIQREADRAGQFLQTQVNLSLGIMDSVFSTLDVARSQVPDPYTLRLIATPAASIVLRRFDDMVLVEGGQEIPVGKQTRPVAPLPPCGDPPAEAGMVVASRPEMFSMSYRLRDQWQGVAFLCAKAGVGLLQGMLNNGVGDALLNARLVHTTTDRYFESTLPAKAGAEPLVRRELKGFPLLVEIRVTEDTWWSIARTRLAMMGLATLVITALILYSSRRSWLFVIALENAAIRDGLTGLLNRRYLFERADFELQRQRRVHEPIGVLLLDIDYFKKVNDTYGHDAGDDVLRAVASLLNNQCRGSDIVARYGGEKFVILFPSTDTESALQLAQRLRTNVEAMTVSTSAGPLQVTFSGGLAMAGANENLTLETLITRADVALYAAKHEGRNRIVLADSQGEPATPVSA